jgi:hypothetical protein
LFVDGSQMAAEGGNGGWSVDAGSHHLNLFDGSQELDAGARQIDSGATLTLRRSDFKAPDPLASDEEQAWDRAEQTQTVKGLEDFLRRYPNSSRRDQAQAELENRYWQAVAKSPTLAGYRNYLKRYPSPQGPHFAAASSELDRLEWQSLQNSADAAKVSAFLARHPRGQYHDLAAARLNQIAQLTTTHPAPQQTPTHEAPTPTHQELPTEPPPVIPPVTPSGSKVQPPTTTSGPKVQNNENDATAIRRVLDAYQDAYESRSVDKLRAIWPTISSSQASNLDRLFRAHNQVRAPYSIVSQNVSGDEVKVQIQQFLELDGRRSPSAKMTIVLKKQVGSTWYISAIQ